MEQFTRFIFIFNIECEKNLSTTLTFFSDRTKRNRNLRLRSTGLTCNCTWIRICRYIVHVYYEASGLLFRRLTTISIDKFFTINLSINFFLFKARYLGIYQLHSSGFATELIREKIHSEHSKFLWRLEKFLIDFKFSSIFISSKENHSPRVFQDFSAIQQFQQYSWNFTILNLKN